MLKVISKQVFKTDRLLRSKWKDEIKKAQEKFNIVFDLENDEDISNIRRLTFDTDSFRWVYLVQLAAASGDWQMPVYYFKIQRTKPFPEPMFVFIPSKNEGNNNLIMGSKGKYIPRDHDYDIEDERDEKKAWEAVKKYLQKESEKEIR